MGFPLFTKASRTSRLRRSLRKQFRKTALRRVMTHPDTMREVGMALIGVGLVVGLGALFYGRAISQAWQNMRHSGADAMGYSNPGEPGI